MTGARVLISGAGGFVAGHIAAGLAAMGYRVCALDLTFDAAAKQRLAGCDLVAADLAADGVALPPSEIVIHGAALTTSPAALGLTSAQHVAANTRPLLTMLTHAGTIRPRAFVYLSSSGVFAATDGAPDLTDTCTPTAQGPYSAAKRAGEALVPGALGDICQTFILRLGYLYGPGEAARASRMKVSLVQGWIDAARNGETLQHDATDPRRDWTFAPDLGPAIDRLLSGPGRAQPIHLCAPNPLCDSNVVDQIRHHYPAATQRKVPGQGAKAPMIPSSVPSLEDFAWTPVADGIARLALAEVGA
ncbi:MAG: NAD(P)-dependent oxidoreductase [Pseudomonadota bacterium]